MERQASDARWQQIQHLFEEVMDLDPAARAPHLDRVCQGDAWLRAEVQGLVAAYEKSGDFLGLEQLAADPAAPEPPAAGGHLQEGTVVCSYRILREVGRGGMGEVYLAHDAKLNRRVALKFLPVHLHADEEATARLLSEARSAAALDHPNIAAVYEIGETPGEEGRAGRLFIVMAYCEGQTLREKMAQGALPVAEALDVAVQVACGLAAAHRKGIVHRDVKPSNLLLSGEGIVKIVDFGLAKTASMDLTRTGRTMGTVAYMAPEQVRGEAVDHRTDLWALGVVLYEMLAGERPFKGDYEAAVLFAVLNQEPVPIRTLRPEVPAEVEQILHKALARDPEARYQSAEALRADLQRAQQGQAPDGAGPAAPGTVTFFFSDIEGSTNLLHQLGAQYGAVLMEQQRLLRATLRSWGGREIDTAGDGFFAVFNRARDAVAAAVAVQRAMAAQAWPGQAAVHLRIGLHTGEPQLAAGNYVGLDVHRAARICSAAHGGQVLLSQATRELVEQELPEGVRVLELGLHRLKDLAAPERLFQLVIPALPSSFPPLKASGSWPANLPAPPTELIGREREVKAVKHLILEEGVRLITLTGPGGMGKTRLSVRVAAEVAAAFEEGVCFVPLAPVTDPAFVASTIAHVLGVREMGSLPIRESLFAFLQDKHGLLVLDNFEQVPEAAEFVAELLAACPFLTVLVTSRASLRVQGEREFPVPPLGVPAAVGAAAPEHLAAYEAVALFVERARAVQPRFALAAENAAAVAEICVRLDGLPLAIELAAARTKVLSPRAILARLERRLDLLTGGERDRPTRHRTLREAIAWSYDLLARHEQALFRWLGVFPGGFTLEAAEAVCCSMEGPEADVLDSLASLIDKNLLRQEEQADGEPRFFMLETIREFALERLRAGGEEAAVRRAHLDFYLQVAEAAEPHLTGPQQVLWLDLLEQEHHNLRAALRHALASEEDLAARLVAALWRFWLTRVYISEGYEYIARLLAEAGPGMPRALRARFLSGASVLATNMGLLATARAVIEESLTLYRELEDQEGIASTLNHLGWILTCLGEHAAARAVSEEALALHRTLNHERGIGVALNNLGFIALFQGGYAVAGAFLEESLAWHRKIEDKRGMIRTLSNLGHVRYYQGHYELAKALQEEALAIMEEVKDLPGRGFTKNRLALALHQLDGSDRAVTLLEEETLPLFRSMGHHVGTMESLAFLGEVLLNLGQYERAAAFCEEFLAKARATGYKPGLAVALCQLANVRLQRGNPAGAGALYRDSLRLRRTMEEKAGTAECLEGLACVAYSQQQAHRAACLLGAAEAVREAASAPLPFRKRAAHEAVRHGLREQLGEAAFAAARAEGRHMTLLQATAYALEEEPQAEALAAGEPAGPL